MTTNFQTGSSAPSARPARTPAPEPSVLRVMLAVVFGFFVFAAELAFGLAIVTVAASPDWIFHEGTWETSASLDVVVVALGAVGGVSGGLIARLLGGSARVTLIFAAALLLTVGVQVTVRSMSTDATAVRSAADSTQANAMLSAHPGPIWTLGVPLAACLGSLLGGAAAGRAQRALLGR